MILIIVMIMKITATTKDLKPKNQISVKRRKKSPDFITQKFYYLSGSSLTQDKDAPTHNLSSGASTDVAHIVIT